MDKYDNYSFNKKMDGTLSSGYDCHKSLNCLSKRKIKFEKYELCKKADLEPIALEINSGRLLKVNVIVKSVCFNNEISVVVIIFNKYGKILAFKAFTTILKRDYSCVDVDCGTLYKKVLFVLPDAAVCDPQEFKVSVIANYTHPCR